MQSPGWLFILADIRMFRGEGFPDEAALEAEPSPGRGDVDEVSSLGSELNASSNVEEPPAAPRTDVET